MEKMFFLGLVFGLAGGALLVANSCKARALVKKSQTELLEKVDAMLASILEGYGEPLIVAAGSDHSTPCAFGEHSGDPVPILLSGPGLRTDGTTAYNESAALGGGLGRLSGRDFLNVVLNAAYRVPKQGS